MKAKPFVSTAARIRALAVGLLVALLALPLPAAAQRVSLADLLATLQAQQVQINELAARLDTLPAGPTALAPGLIGSTLDYDDCLINELGLNCEERTQLLVALPEHTFVWLTTVEAITVQVGGEPVLREQSGEWRLQRPPPAGSACPVHQVEARVTLTSFDGVQAHETFCLGPDSPVFGEDFGSPFKSFRAVMVDSSKVALYVGQVQRARTIEFESGGVILEAFAVEEAGSNVARMHVNIQNFGDLAVNYLVTVTDVVGCGGSVQPRWQILEPVQIADLELDLPGCDGVGVARATVSLLAPTGRVYDRVNVIFDKH